MIITCINCTKNFEIVSDLIPEKGRLLQCGDCNHTWFYKKEISNKHKLDEIENPKIIGIIDDQIENEFKKDIPFFTKDINEHKRNYKILSPIIVFFISFIAIIIILDTFQVSISKIFPNIEFFLYNLYESINDFFLFLKDLI